MCVSGEVVGSSTEEVSEVGRPLTENGIVNTGADNATHGDHVITTTAEIAFTNSVSIGTHFAA